MSAFSVDMYVLCHTSVNGMLISLMPYSWWFLMIRNLNWILPEHFL